MEPKSNLLLDYVKSGYSVGTSSLKSLNPNNLQGTWRLHHVRMRENWGQSFCLLSPSMDYHPLPTHNRFTSQSSIHLIQALCLPLLYFHFFSQSQTWNFSSLLTFISISTSHPFSNYSAYLQHWFHIPFSFSLSLSAFEKEDNWGMSLRDHYLLLMLNISPNGWIGKVMLRIKTRDSGRSNRREIKGGVHFVESDW